MTFVSYPGMNSNAFTVVSGGEVARERLRAHLPFPNADQTQVIRARYGDPRLDVQRFVAILVYFTRR